MGQHNLSVSLLLTLAAGSTQLSSLRNYLVTFSTFLLATMLSIDPGLTEERSRPFEQATTPGRFAAALSFLATLVLAALDIGRLHRFDSVPGTCARAVSCSSPPLPCCNCGPWSSIPSSHPRFVCNRRSTPAHRLRALPLHAASRLSRHAHCAPASGLAIGSWLHWFRHRVLPCDPETYSR